MSNNQISMESIKMNYTHENTDKFKAFPRKRQEEVKWNGWGYKDCQFEIMEGNVMKFKGDRYPALANEILPKLKPWFEERCDADINIRTPSRDKPNVEDYPDPNLNEGFVS